MSNWLHDRSYREERRRDDHRRESHRREEYARDGQQRDSYRPHTQNRYADVPRHRHDQRPSEPRDLRERVQDTRAEAPSSRRRFTEKGSALRATEPGTSGRPHLASQEPQQPHSNIPAIRGDQLQEPAGAADQAAAMPEHYQKRHGYLTDSLRENRHKQYPNEGYVSNRDRQQNNRHHPYLDNRSGDSEGHGQNDRQTGMVADRSDFGAKPYRRSDGYGVQSARGRGFSNEGRPWRQNMRGGFGGGGGKWKHDMFSELTKPSEENTSNGIATLSKSQPAQPSGEVI